MLHVSSRSRNAPAHALLDGLRTRFLTPSSPEQAAFHEAFAHLVALLRSSRSGARSNVCLAEAQGEWTPGCHGNPCTTRAVASPRLRGLKESRRRARIRANSTSTVASVVKRQSANPANASVDRALTPTALQACNTCAVSQSNARSVRPRRRDLQAVPACTSRRDPGPHREGCAGVSLVQTQKVGGSRERGRGRRAQRGYGLVKPYGSRRHRRRSRGSCSRSVWSAGSSPGRTRTPGRGRRGGQ